MSGAKLLAFEGPRWLGIHIELVHVCTVHTVHALLRSRDRALAREMDPRYVPDYIYHHDAHADAAKSGSAILNLLFFTATITTVVILRQIIQQYCLTSME